MRLTYTQEARLALVEAASYYRSCRQELAREFKQQIEAAERYPQPPRGLAQLERSLKRKPLRQFPYSLIYHQP